MSSSVFRVGAEAGAQSSRGFGTQAEETAGHRTPRHASEAPVVAGLDDRGDRVGYVVDVLQVSAATQMRPVDTA